MLELRRRASHQVTSPNPQGSPSHHVSRSLHQLYGKASPQIQVVARINVSDKSMTRYSWLKSYLLGVYAFAAHVSSRYAGLRVSKQFNDIIWVTMY